MTTANRLYLYDIIYFGKTLTDWVQELHKYNCEKNNWNCAPLKPGSYGFDNLAMCLGDYFSCENREDIKDIEKVAEQVHESWKDNYEYWRDISPWEFKSRELNGGMIYIKPYAPLNDERRNLCATLKYSELSEEEQNKDKIIAEFLIGKIDSLFSSSRKN